MDAERTPAPPRTPSGRLCLDRVRAGLRQHESERGLAAVKRAPPAQPGVEAGPAAPLSCAAGGDAGAT